MVKSGVILGSSGQIKMHFLADKLQNYSKWNIFSVQLKIDLVILKGFPSALTRYKG
jgi:hypothetical protein